MDLQNLLPKSHVICLDDTTISRRTLLGLLTEPLVADGIVTDSEAFLDALDLREADMTTQMKGGIALPHACSTAVKRLGLVIGRMADPGINFDPDSEEKCLYFFLMSVPASAPAAHLPLFSHIAGFITAPGKLEKLRSTEDQEAIWKLITAWKRN